MERRPIKTRSKAWVQYLATALLHLKVGPNAISLMSIVFSFGACCSIIALNWADSYSYEKITQVILLWSAAACIQLRLLANLLDGIVAVEGGKGGPVGDLYNEVPDRIADLLIIVPFGYILDDTIVWQPQMIAWLAGCGALLTAYVRALGASLTQNQVFHGPMAKPHRMFLLTCACLFGSGIIYFTTLDWLLWFCLVLIICGTIVTSARRLLVISAMLRKAAL